MVIEPKWECVDTGREVHTFPIDDLIEHVLHEDDCICGPVQENHGRWLYIHHSLDGREIV